MVFLSLPLNKGQTMTKLAEKGRKGFRAICAMAIEVDNGQKAENGRKRRPGIKKEEKNRPKKIFALLVLITNYLL